jgi:superfamily II DNA or RNA helicase
MPKKMTTEEFIAKARKVHGDKYDYSKVEYKGSKEKVCIICPEHGDFWQLPSNHLKCCGCPECGGNVKMTTSDFIAKARDIHGNKYDYSKVNYVNADTKVCIICPEHGAFLQTPSNHLLGKGCSKCGIENNANKKRLSTEDFIRRAIETHGNKYDYSKVEYVDSQTPVCIVCPEHGEFWQVPTIHWNGAQCPKCASEKNGRLRKMSLDEFIRRAQKVHGNKYDYSKVEYISANTKICIICPEHGEFNQTPSKHLQGSGCPKCIGRGVNTEEWIKKAREVHGDKYDYSKVEYVDSVTKVCIVCPEHGDFWQTPSGHLQGRGCLKCSGVKKKTTEEFIEDAKKVHGNKYDYSKVEYKSNKDNVCIICPEHGEFWLLPIVHLRGQGCLRCIRPSSNLTTEEFVVEAKKVHGDRYDYSKVEYKKSTEKVCIICPKHGEYWQKPYDHLIGKGCPTCAYDRIAEKFKLSKVDFVKKAKEVHGDKYDYSKVEYVNNNTKVCIVCHEHGEFWQKPSNHLMGNGCPICNSGFTKSYILNLIKETDLEAMTNHQLIELISLKKLPEELKVLAFSPAGSIERINTLGQLKNTLEDSNISDLQAEEIINEEIEKQEKLQNERINDSESTESNDYIDAKEIDDTLPELVMRSLHIYDNERFTASGEGEKFIKLESIQRLWNETLKDEENFIAKLKAEEGGEFFNAIKTEFFREYDEVVNIKVDENYRFKYQPNLMQKLMVYRIASNNYYGNWCGTGAGKSLARDFASRKINSRVSVYIVPNAVIATTEKSILEVYPDSKIYVPKFPSDIISMDRNSYNYIIFNYEKYQLPNTQEYIENLLGNNIVDFICLDEIQNVKVRDTDNISLRNQQINKLIKTAREQNANLKVLAMSATPIINNLQEVKSLMELLTGKEYEEIKNKTSINNIHEAYKALLMNGFRYIPKYDIKVNTEYISVDGDIIVDELLAKNNNDMLGIDQILASVKIDEIIRQKKLKKGTLIYSQFVTGIIPMIYDRVSKSGYKVASYTGNDDEETRRDIIGSFANGNIDVLVASSPITTGVDGLQKCCDRMIIISAPWTNSDYVQLVGRIYRQGSIFKEVDVIIPQVEITTDDGEWSWDKRRMLIIETKKTLGEAVMDGALQKAYNSEGLRSRLISMAMDALKSGLEDRTIERKNIEIEAMDITPKQMEYAESYVNEIHRAGNTCRSNTMHERFQKNKDEFIEYHRQREIAKREWQEDPVDRVAEIISDWSGRFNRIADMGCGMNKLKSVLTNREVQGFDHYSEDSSVIQSDMSNLKGIVSDESYDVAVFCLSLWGTNYDDYFVEAHRILRLDGRMIIVEPETKFGNDERFDSIENFINKVENYGFERKGNYVKRFGFVYFKFERI